MRPVRVHTFLAAVTLVLVLTANLHPVALAQDQDSEGTDEEDAQNLTLVIRDGWRQVAPNETTRLLVQAYAFGNVGGTLHLDAWVNGTGFPVRFATPATLNLSRGGDADALLRVDVPPDADHGFYDLILEGRLVTANGTVQRATHATLEVTDTPSRFFGRTPEGPRYALNATLLNDTATAEPGFLSLDGYRVHLANDGWDDLNVRVRLVDPNATEPARGHWTPLFPGTAINLTVPAFDVPETPGNHTLHLHVDVVEDPDLERVFPVRLVVHEPRESPWARPRGNDSWMPPQPNLTPIDVDPINVSLPEPPNLTGFTPEPNYTVEQTPDPLELVPGESGELRVRVTNTGNVPLRMRVERGDGPLLYEQAGVPFRPTDAGRVTDVTFEPTVLTVPPGNTRILRVNLTAPDDAPVGEERRVPLAFHDAMNDFTDAHAVRVRFVDAPEPAAASEPDTGVRSLANRIAAFGAEHPVATAAATAGAGLTLAGVALARRDAWRYAIAAGLYSRLQPSEVLDHETRERLVDLIREHPGVHYGRLKTLTGLNTGTLVHHLRTLERNRLVTSRREGRYRCFYPAGGAPARDRAERRHTPMQARVLELLDEVGELTQRELAERLGLTQQGVSYHLKRLERMGDVHRELVAGESRYRRIHTLDVVDASAGPSRGRARS